MKLSAHLAEQGLTERQFGTMIGASQAAVNRYCRGRVPTPEVMKRIVTATNGAVTANDFFDTAPDPSPAPQAAAQ